MTYMYYNSLLFRTGLLLLFVAFGSCTFLHPVILVPGDGGSQIEARINKSDSSHWFCYSHADWYDLWLNLEEMLWPAVDCWEENMQLQYANGTTFNRDGVETRVPGFGLTEHVEWLDKSKRSVGLYYNTIVEALVKQGYERDVNIHGAPYDFRKAANEHQEYFALLKNLIETTYEQNHESKVIMITHSMGSIMTYHFLIGQPKEWKEKYIRSFISMSGVFGGTVTAVKVFAVGDNLRSYFLNEKSLLWQRTCPSLAWLMPSRYFWNDTEVLIETPDKTLTRTDLDEFFMDVSPTHGPNMISMVNDTKDLLRDFPAPEVEMHCLYGVGVPTIDKLVYAKGYYPQYDPKYSMGDGDGTVNIRSLQGCMDFEQAEPIHSKKFDKMDHLQLIKDPKAAAHVGDIIMRYNQELKFEDDNVKIQVF